ncbi:MAG: type II toxin-antitoxin system HigB family toxin [Chloroflexota bacterium]
MRISYLTREDAGMRIIARRRLMQLAQAHGDCVDQVADWYRVARKNSWKNLVELRESFRHADSVGDMTVFNIKGNDYRLIVHIRYDQEIIYIKNLLTHAQYDKGTWRD